MAANVENMFSVKETPWHGLGSVIHDAPSISEGLKLAGLDWDVEVETPQLSDGTSLADFGRVFRRSTDKSVLGIVGPNTHPLQNAKAFDFFEPFIAAKEATLETAGSLSHGQRIWVMAKIARDNAVIVKDDEIAKFVLLSNSHDGTQAVRVGFTPIRVVCANTLAMAHRDKRSELLRVRHSKNVEINLDKIRDIINLADEQFEATAEQYRALANRDINQNDLRNYVKLVFDVPEDETEVSTRKKNMIAEILGKHEKSTGFNRLAMDLVNRQMKEENKQILESVTEKFETGLGTDILRGKCSLWTAYNAVTEYLNYDRGHNSDTRMNSLWFGENQRMNDKAFKAALELLAV